MKEEPTKIAVDAGVSLDVSENITMLIEKLAQQIGTTVDQIFPWYVKQASVEGWIIIGVILAWLLLSLVLLALGGLFWYRVDRTPDKDRSEIFFGVGLGCLIVGGIAFILTLLIGGTESIDAIAQIKNPEYYAMKSLVADMARLKP